MVQSVCVAPSNPHFANASLSETTWSRAAGRTMTTFAVDARNHAGLLSETHRKLWPRKPVRFALLVPTTITLSGSATDVWIF